MAEYISERVQKYGRQLQCKSQNPYSSATINPVLSTKSVFNGINTQGFYLLYQTHNFYIYLLSFCMHKISVIFCGYTCLSSQTVSNLISWGSHKKYLTSYQLSGISFNPNGGYVSSFLPDKNSYQIYQKF